MSLAAAAVVIATTCAHAEGPERVYVVTSDQPAFAVAARAAVAALDGNGQLVRADDSAKAALANASIVIAVGPLAERLVAQVAPSDARIIDCLTPYAPEKRAGVLAVPLRPSTGDVFAIVRALLPSARLLGVFPGPGSDPQVIRDAAKSADLEVSFPRNGEHFAASVDRLIEVADAVFIEDAASLPNGGTTLVVKRASDQRKQVVGPNRSTVLQGALFAVVPDPVAHGKAAGTLALRALHGEAASVLPTLQGHVLLNGALAKTLGAKTPASLSARVEVVE